MLWAMLMWSVEGVVLSFLLWPVWVAVLLLLVMAGLAAGRPTDDRPRVLELAAAALGAPAITLWGVLFYGSLEGVPNSAWRWESLGVDALFCAEAALVLWLVWRHRARWAAAVVTGAAGVVWAGGAWIIASMAVVNDWM